MFFYLICFLVSFTTFIYGYNEIIHIGITVKALGLILITPVISFLSTLRLLYKNKEVTNENN